MKASRVDSGVDRVRVRELKQAEDARFRDAHPGRWRCWSAAGGRCRTACRWPGWSAVPPPAAVDRVGARARASPTSTATSTPTSTSPTCRCSAATARAGGRGGEPAGGPRQPVPAADRGLDLGSRGAGPPLRPADVAVHAGGDERQHRGHPGRPGRDRPREGAVLRRQVPRPLRRGAGRARRTAGWCRRRAACPARRHRRTVVVPFNDPAPWRVRSSGARWRW